MELDGAGMDSIVSFLYHWERGPLAEEEQESLEAPVTRPVVWLGTSRKNIQDFPPDAHRLVGGQLQLLQYGGMPKDAKPFKGIGGGVSEIALRHDGEAYRTVVALQPGRAI
jgi:phage-related protein